MTLSVAATTKQSIVVQVSADAATVGLSLRTGADTRRADFSAGAFGATLPAVVDIGLRVHARATAIGLTQRTTGNTLAVEAALTGFANVATLPTVAQLVGEVSTVPTAIGEPTRTSASTVGAKFSTVAGSPTVSTVGAITFGINA